MLFWPKSVFKGTASPSPPQLRNIAELRTKKSCGTAIANLQTLTSAIPQLSAVSCQFRYFLVPFPQLRMVLKINQKYFLELFLLKLKTCLKGTVVGDFWPPIFFSQIDLIPDSYPKLFSYGNGSWKIQRQKILCYCPFKILWIAKNTWWKKNI